MKSQKLFLPTVFAFLVYFLFPSLSLGEDASASTEGTSEVSEEESLEQDFRSQDAFLDQHEGLRSKQYVRRAILSTVISASNRVAFNRFYINHLLGFNAIYHKKPFAKYVSGVHGLSVGYAFEPGHAIEIGMDFSTINALFAGYRYFFRPERLLLWPAIGIGAGREMQLVKFAEGPPESQTYTGSKTLFFGSLGILVPLVDVAIKAEVRISAYGADRFVLTQGIGAVLFF